MLRLKIPKITFTPEKFTFYFFNMEVATGLQELGLPAMPVYKSTEEALKNIENGPVAYEFVKNGVYLGIVVLDKSKAEGLYTATTYLKQISKLTQETFGEFFSAYNKTKDEFENSGKAINNYLLFTAENGTSDFNSLLATLKMAGDGTSDLRQFMSLLGKYHILVLTTGNMNPFMDKTISAVVKLTSGIEMAKVKSQEEVPDFVKVDTETGHIRRRVSTEG